MKKLSSRVVLGLVTAAVLCSAAFAADWPTKTIQFIVPYTAGGDTDLYCRAIAKAMQKQLGVTIAVTNITGAKGMNACVDVAEGASNGSKVLFGHNSFLAQVACKNAVVDVTKELKAGGSLVSDLSLTLVATKKSGFKNLKELVEASKARPNEIRKSGTFGTYPYFVTEQLQDKAGCQWRQIALGPSVSDNIVAALGDQCDLISNQYIVLKEYIAAGDFIALGVVSPERLPGMENIPTFKEQGYDVTAEKNYCFWFNGETDDEIIRKFASALEACSKDEELVNTLKNYFCSVKYLSPEAMQKMEEDTVAEMEKYFAKN